MTTATTIAHPASGAVPTTPGLSDEARRALLDVARAALAVAAGQASGAVLASRLREAQAVQVRAAVFVTLMEDGALRGCMGTLDPDQPVADAVARAAMTAALDDPRFYPLEAGELERTHVDVSVLGVPAELADVEDFVPGVDGVIVERAGRRALLLPEVATDQGWDGMQMLEAVCRKAGLGRDAWREPGTRRSAFRTVRFGGPATVSAAASHRGPDGT